MPDKGKISDQIRTAPVTAQEIALRTGVAQCTVSRILSASPNHRFAAETRRRVIAEAERLGYRPHAVGRSLRERRTRVVGFYSWYGHLDARNPFQAEIIGGLQRGASENGYAVLLQNFPEGTSESDIFGQLTNGRVDGLIVHSRPLDPLVARLAGATLPAIAIADAVPALPSVVVDDRDGVRQAICHLAERGHQHIAFLHPAAPLPSALVRLAAYQDEMAQRGWEALPLMIHYEDAEPAVDVLWQMSPRPTAVCCWNDLSALRLLRACQRRGISVPGDLALIGFDGVLDARLMERPLTTIAVHWPDVSRTAFSLLLKHTQGEQIPDLTILPAVLRLGETT